MPPFSSVVDLTGDSDDDDRFSSKARPRPSGHVSANKRPKSTLSYVKQTTPKAAPVGTTPKRRKEHAFVDTIDLSPEPSASQRSSKHMTAANSTTDRRRELHASQNAINPKNQPGSGSAFSRTLREAFQVRESFQKSVPRTETVSDNRKEKPMSRPPQFQTPRGDDEASSQTRTGSGRRLDSPFNGVSSGRPKRPHQDDDLLDRSGPFKKQKVTPNTNESSSNVSTDIVSRHASKRRDGDDGDIVRKRSKVAPPNFIPAGRFAIDLSSPPQNTQKSRLVSDQSRDRTESARTQKLEPTLRAAYGESQASVDSSKNARDHPLSNGRVKSSQRTPGSQLNSLKKPSTPLSTKNERLRQGDSKESTDPLQRSDTLANRPSIRDTTPRVRKETPKAQAISATKKLKSQSDSGRETPSTGRRGSSPQTPDSRRTGGTVRQSARKLFEGPSHGSSYNGHREQSRGSRKSRSPAPRYRDARRSSSDDDPGYGSLSSSEKDNVQESAADVRKAEVEEADSRAKSASSSHATRTRKENREAADFNSRPNLVSGSLNQGTSDAHNPVAGSSANRKTTKTVTPHRRPSRAEQDLSDIHGSSVHTTHSRTSNSLHRSPSRSKSPRDLGDKSERRTMLTVRQRTPVGAPTTAAEEADLQLRSEEMEGIERTASAAETEKPFAIPASPASAMKRPSIYSNLPLANQVEKVLGKHLEELREDNEYWTSVSMNRARLAKEEQSKSGHGGDTGDQPGELTSFAHLKPLGFTQHQKGSSVGKSDQLWGIEKMGANSKSSGPTWMSAPYTMFTSDTQDVPNYAHYVSIKNNILAPNMTNLHYWPYFGDDFDMSDALNLKDQYNLDIDPRERKLILLAKAQKYEEYVESALQDLGCNWADVLRFLLEERPDVGTDLDARKALQHRPEFCEDDFTRDGERWRAVLSKLPSSNTEKLARVAVLCHNFQKMAKFSLWQIARRSDYADLPEESDSKRKVHASDNDLTCRVCLRFNCPYHGELKEYPEGGSAGGSVGEHDEEADSLVEDLVATDVVHPPKVNYRTRIAFPAPCLLDVNPDENAPAKADKRDPKYWKIGNFHHQPDERGPFYPCSHPGTSCENAKCSCFANQQPCEKICGCAPDCDRKFQGCACSTEKLRRGQRSGCFEDDRCACFMVGRECDPDLCGGCGVCEVIDPVNKYDDEILLGRCRNCSIQRGVPKQTLLGDSGIHGLGLYACEEIREHEFVGEYKGEIITKEEAERRGAVYEYQKLSYLFSLNKTQEIDSTYFGNKVRFINHASGNRASLYPRIIMVNTVHRIALYASGNIRLGQELLFDYGPKFPDEQLGGKKSKKSAPSMHNPNLSKTFLNVEEREDEVGNLRAKGVTRTLNSRQKQKNKRPRGGARPGAGRKPRGPRAQNEAQSTTTYSEQDAEERLQTYNVSDEVPSDKMDADGDGGEEDEDDDEAFEPEDYDSLNSEGSYDSERSDYENDDVDDELDLGQSKRPKVGMKPRRSRR